MKHYLQLLPRFKIVFTLCSLALSGSILWLFVTENGVGISPDSVDYYTTAQHWVAHQGFIQFNGQPLVIFPLGYPLFLGICLKSFPISIIALANVLQPLLLLLLLCLCCLLAYRVFAHSSIAYVLVIGIVTSSYCLFDIYTMLWSETLFLIISLLVIGVLYQYLQKPSWQLLTLAAFLLAFLCITRLAGVAFAGSAVLCMLLFDQQTLWQKTIRFFYVGVLSSSLLIANLVRNYCVTGWLTGIRQASDRTLYENIGYWGGVLLNWLQLPNSNAMIHFCIGTLVWLGLVWLCINRWKQTNNLLCTMLMIHGLVYVLFAVTTASISKYEPLNNRLLSPAYVPLLLGTAGIMSSFKQTRKTHISGLLLGLALILAQYVSLYQQYQDIVDDGIPGYTEKNLVSHPLIQQISKPNEWMRMGKATVYSNAYEAAHFFSGLPCLSVPEAAHTHLIHSYLHSPPHYLIWFFDDYDNTAILRLPILLQNRKVDTLVSVKEGQILWLH